MAAGEQQRGGGVSVATAVIVPVISSALSSPLGRLRELVQVQGELVRTGHIDKPYTGYINCAKLTFKSEGLWYFWRGFLVESLGPVVKKTLNKAGKRVAVSGIPISAEDSIGSRVCKIMAHAQLGQVGFMIIYPLDVARLKYVADIGSDTKYTGILDVLKKTYVEQGILGLYNGLGTSIFGVLLYRGLYFGLYDTFKVKLGKNPTFLEVFMLGMGVTIVAGWITYPIDTIRKRLILGNVEEETSYSGVMSCVKSIIREDGILSLWNGAGMRLLGGLTGVVTLILYDTMRTSSK